MRIVLYQIRLSLGGGLLAVVFVGAFGAEQTVQWIAAGTGFTISFLYLRRSSGQDVRPAGEGK